MENPPLGRLKRVDPRTVWSTEDRDFTPWLARPENLKVLADTLDLELEPEARERPVGPFRADILCKEVGSDSWVLIENQLDRTDHRHLGQLLTYAAGLDATTIVWVATPFVDEHRAALDWLNRITDENFQFFGLEIELWQIGESPPAPRFDVVSKPNEWSRSTRKDADTRFSETQKWQLKYWESFHATLDRLYPALRGNRKPLPANWIGYHPFGRAEFKLHVTVRKMYKQIQSGLIIEDKKNKRNSEAFFGLLEQEKDDIESEIGVSLNWQKLLNNYRCRIDLPLDDTDPTVEADWPRQHQWLADKLNALHRVFSPRVKVLDADDWHGEDAEPEG